MFGRAHRPGSGAARPDRHGTPTHRQPAYPRRHSVFRFPENDVMIADGGLDGVEADPRFVPSATEPYGGRDNDVV